MKLTQDGLFSISKSERFLKVYSHILFEHTYWKNNVKCLHRKTLLSSGRIWLSSKLGESNSGKTKFRIMKFCLNTFSEK